MLPVIAILGMAGQAEADTAVVPAEDPGGSIAAAQGGKGRGGRGRGPRAEAKARRKLVVRGLPPALTEEAFVASLGEWEQKTIYKQFCPGKQAGKKGRESKAFIALESAEEVLPFFEAYDGHTFTDERGQEHRARVSYAPFQRLPKSKAAANKKAGTLATDSSYLKFVEELEQPQQFLPSAEVQLDARLNEEREIMAQWGGVMPPKISPLLKDLMAKKQLKAQRNAKRQERIRAKGAGKGKAGGPVGAQGAPAKGKSKAKGKKGPAKGKRQKKAANKTARGGAAQLEHGSVVLAQRAPAASQKAP